MYLRSTTSEKTVTFVHIKVDNNANRLSCWTIKQSDSKKRRHFKWGGHSLSHIYLYFYRAVCTACNTVQPGESCISCTYLTASTLKSNTTTYLFHSVCR